MSNSTVIPPLNRKFSLFLAFNRRSNTFSTFISCGEPWISLRYYWWVTCASEHAQGHQETFLLSSRNSLSVVSHPLWSYTHEWKRKLYLDGLEGLLEWTNVICGSWSIRDVGADVEVVDVVVVLTFLSVDSSKEIKSIGAVVANVNNI